ncbi:MAG: hypothetical protein K9M94_13765, partial [Spirochaetia bacterium]|nr:hypothetical protein [Spirochaetia bacterium]
IQEFSLVQAVHYAYEQLLPGGSFPVSFIFLEIDPELVDFNIHPAKREVRIKNLPEIHHQLVHTLQEHLNRKYITPQEPQQTPVREMDFGPPVADRPFTVPLEKWKEFGSQRGESAAEQASEVQVTEPRPPDAQEIEYVGQVFDLFLIVRRGESLYMIDQHAAHERIIYEQLTGGTVQSQSLLVPYTFEVEEDVEALLRQRLDEYRQIGIQLEQEKAGQWRITRVPARFVGLEEQLIEALQSQEASETAFKARLFADLACKAAVKDGEVLDRYSAADLARQAFELSVPRCPHGRPIWFRISRNELFEIVGRT